MAHPNAASNIDRGNLNLPIDKKDAETFGCARIVEGEPTHSDGKLSWKDGAEYIKETDIVAVLNNVIWSLEEVADGKLPQLRSTYTAHLPDSFRKSYEFHPTAGPAYIKSNSTDDGANNSRRPTLYILISTLSGTQLAVEFCSSILRPVLQAIGLGQGSYTLVQTSSADSVKEFARDVLYTNATEGHAQTVIMLSGDGGTVDILNQLYTSNGQSRGSSYVMPLLCLFPLGTGNALYHSIQRPHTLPSIYVQALRTFLHGEPVPLPAYRATFSPGSRLLSNQGQTQTKLVEDTLYGAVVISYGFHATLVAESDTAEYRKYGDKRFGMVAKALLLPDNGKSPPHAYKADVLIVSDNGRKTTVGETQRHGYVLASLVSNLERAFTISPKSSKRLDGKLRLVHFGDLDATEVNLIMTAAYQDGNHVHLPEVLYQKVNELEVLFKEEGSNWGWRRCCIDGLIVGVEENGWMKVNTVESGEEAVQVLLPPSLTG